MGTGFSWHFFIFVSCRFQVRAFCGTLLGIHGRQWGIPGNSLPWCSSGPEVSRRSSSCFPPFLPIFVCYVQGFLVLRGRTWEKWGYSIFTKSTSFRVCENSVNTIYVIINMSSFFIYTTYQTLWLKLSPYLQRSHSFMESKSCETDFNLPHGIQVETQFFILEIKLNLTPHHLACWYYWRSFASHGLIQASFVLWHTRQMGQGA